MEGYVEHYNNMRLKSAIGNATPKDMLAGQQQGIQAERDRKLEVAREQPKNRRQRPVTDETDYPRLADYPRAIGEVLTG